ncbi:thioredoxin family protein [Nevskia ramosa]|uniref:thioredoxin family protein n=1 Tax=Nevskia ramosa TaxID=64002 RepID=UPI00235609A6|nr:thioredoxin family protein [Nevskia ramosa]
MRLMKNLGMIAAGMAFSAAAWAAPSVGAPAPAFSAVDSNGKTVSLADYKGKHVVLEWTNDGCPFVKKHYGSGNMQSLQKEFTAQNVVWLSVISSAPGQQGYVDGAAANKLTAARGAAPTAVLLDPKGDIGRLYGAKTTPHLFVIDPAGKLEYAGGIDSIASPDPADIAGATPFLKVALTEALAGKAISTPVTKPYGCSVKYG